MHQASRTGGAGNGQEGTAAEKEGDSMSQNALRMLAKTHLGWVVEQEEERRRDPEGTPPIRA